MGVLVTIMQAGGESAVTGFAKTFQENGPLWAMVGLVLIATLYERLFLKPKREDALQDREDRREEARAERDSEIAQGLAKLHTDFAKVAGDIDDLSDDVENLRGEVRDGQRFVGELDKRISIIENKTQ